MKEYSQQVLCPMRRSLACMGKCFEVCHNQDDYLGSSVITASQAVSNNASKHLSYVCLQI